MLHPLPKSRKARPELNAFGARNCFQKNFETDL